MAGSTADTPVAEVTATIERITALNYKFDAGLERPVWMPRGQVLNSDHAWKIGETVKIQVRRWVAIRLGLIAE